MPIDWNQLQTDPLFNVGAGLLAQPRGRGAVGRGLLSGMDNLRKAQQYQAQQKQYDNQQLQFQQGQDDRTRLLEGIARKEAFIKALGAKQPTTQYPLLTAEYNKTLKAGAPTQKFETIEYWKDGKKQPDMRVMAGNANVMRQTLAQDPTVTWEKPEKETSLNKLLNAANITDPELRKSYAEKMLKRQTSPETILNIPAGYRLNENNDLEIVPGGPASRPNQQQGEAQLYADRASSASKIITKMEGQYNRLGLAAKQGAGKMWVIGGALESLGNIFLPEEAQQVEQAKRNFINAILRRESGAAIADSEFENADKQYFPQIGDGPKVVSQKLENRRVAIKGIGSMAIPTLGDTNEAAISDAADETTDRELAKEGVKTKEWFTKKWLSR